MKKKILVACLCVALAMLTIAGTTLAYLTSKDEVTNSFTVGKVNITLDEKDVDELGVPEKDATGAEKSRVKKNDYKLMPGHTYTKDPTVHVDADSEDCYLFVEVVNGIVSLEAKGNTTVAKQMETNGWKTVEGKSNLYVYVGKATGANTPLVVTKSPDVTVFEKLVIADDVTNEMLTAYANNTNKTGITVTAYAVQKDGFEGKTAAEIWDATFGKQPTTNP